MEKEKVGYIYILTNEAFHKSNWVKIGYTENIDQRLKSLYNTSVTTPFEVYSLMKFLHQLEWLTNHCIN